jgi:hypothetical protein
LFSISGVVVNQANIAVGGYSPTFGYSVSFPDACNIYRAAGSDFQYASMIGVPALSYVTPIGVTSRVDEDWTMRHYDLGAQEIGASGDPNLTGNFIPFSGHNVIIGDGSMGHGFEVPMSISLGVDGLYTPIVTYDRDSVVLNIGPLVNFSRQLTMWTPFGVSIPPGGIFYYTHDDSHLDIGVPSPFVLGSYHEDVVDLTLTSTDGYALSADDYFKIIGIDYSYANTIQIEDTGAIALIRDGVNILCHDTISSHSFFPHTALKSSILMLGVPHNASDITITKIHYISTADLIIDPFPVFKS